MLNVENVLNKLRVSKMTKNFLEKLTPQQRESLICRLNDRMTLPTLQGKKFPKEEKKAYNTVFNRLDWIADEEIERQKWIDQMHEATKHIDEAIERAMNAAIAESQINSTGSETPVREENVQGDVHSEGQNTVLPA